MGKSAEQTGRDDESLAKGGDTEAYEVEKIVGNSIFDCTIYYDVKWKGYENEENTQEPEFRLNCDDMLLDYVLTRIDPRNYIDLIPQNFESLHKMKESRKTVLDILNPISTIGHMTVQGGSVKFVNVNTIASELSYLGYLIFNNQSYILNSAHVPVDNEIRRDMEQYLEELTELQKCFPDSPKVQFKVPRQIGGVFYPPPPLSSLLFEPVSEEMFEKREQYKFHFPPKSHMLGFNKINPFIEPSHFDLLKNKAVGPIAGMDRSVDFRRNPRFNVSMRITQQPTQGWVLTLNEDIDEDTALMVMAGVIRPREVADECFKNDGERVAFSSFIEIPNTGMCLDRREFYDFSKFIPHSCEPTCDVRLVNSGNAIPDLVVFSICPIDSSCSYAVTLDYYKMFQKDVKKHFKKHDLDSKIFTLYDEGSDFVHCQCSMPECLEVLFISPKNEAVEKSMQPNKMEKEVESSVFGGLKLAESDQLYNIVDGRFVQ